MIDDFKDGTLCMVCDTPLKKIDGRVLHANGDVTCDQKYKHKLFILYDGRAKTQDTDDCTILVSCDVKKFKKGNGWWHTLSDSKHFEGYDAVWFEYDVVNGELINEKKRADLHRGLFL